MCADGGRSVCQGFLLTRVSGGCNLEPCVRTHPLIRVPRYWPFVHFMDGKSLICVSVAGSGVPFAVVKPPHNNTEDGPQVRPLISLTSRAEPRRTRVMCVSSHLRRPTRLLQPFLKLSIFLFSQVGPKNCLSEGEADMHRESLGERESRERWSSRRLTSLDTPLIRSFWFTA